MPMVLKQCLAIVSYQDALNNIFLLRYSNWACEVNLKAAEKVIMVILLTGLLALVIPLCPLGTYTFLVHLNNHESK